MSIEERLLQLITSEFSEQLEEKLTADAPLLNNDGGPLDSLGAQLLLASVEDEFDVELLDEDISLETFQSVHALARVVESRTQSTTASS